MLSIHVTLQLVTKVTSHNFHATYDQRAIIQWPLRKTMSDASAKLMIQRPYMAIQENFGTCFPSH